MKIILFPGSFKPPHIGHYNALINSLSVNPDKIYIIISSKLRENINPIQSKKIWQLYNKNIKCDLSYIISNDSPIKYTINEVINNPQNEYFLIYGKDESKRFDYIKNYPNIQIINAGNINNINARDFRKYLLENKNIYKFIPNNINMKKVKNILKENQFTQNNKDKILIIDKLVEYCCHKLSLNDKPKINLINNSSYSDKYKSYGGYYPSTKKIDIVIYKRTLADLCRTLSHEICHYYQDINNKLTPNAGEDGDIFENEANSFSGKVMREFGKLYPEIYTLTFE